MGSDICLCPTCDGEGEVDQDTYFQWIRAALLDESNDTVAVESATEEEPSQDLTCQICQEDVDPDNQERTKWTPCCQPPRMMHRHCLKSLVGTVTVVENVATVDGGNVVLQDVAVSRNICPNCRTNWDEDAPAPANPETYRNFVRALENAVLSEEELALQQDE